VETYDNEIYVTPTKIIVPLSLAKTEQAAFNLIHGRIKDIKNNLDEYHYFYILTVDKDEHDYIFHYKIVFNYNVAFVQEEYKEKLRKKLLEKK